jgi:hypothetical protein
MPRAKKKEQRHKSPPKRGPVAAADPEPIISVHRPNYKYVNMFLDKFIEEIVHRWFTSVALVPRRGQYTAVPYLIKFKGELWINEEAFERSYITAQDDYRYLWSITSFERDIMDMNKRVKYFVVSILWRFFNNFEDLTGEVCSRTSQNSLVSPWNLTIENGTKQSRKECQKRKLWDSFWTPEKGLHFGCTHNPVCKRPQAQPTREQIQEITEPIGEVLRAEKFPEMEEFVILMYVFK